MSPAALLHEIDLALAPGVRGRHRLVLTAPVVLGQRGRHLPSEAEVPKYGYTKRQCRRIRGVIYAAARADLGPRK